MKQYELTLVLPGKSKAKEKTVKEKIEKMVKTLEGSVKEAKNWGEIDLSYRINKERTGFFMFFELELNGKAAKALAEKMRLEDDVMRYLLVSKD